jgi:hypothetical protein
MVLPLLCECASVRGSDNQPRTQNDPYQRKGVADQSNPRDSRRNGQTIDLDRAACGWLLVALQHGFLPFVPGLAHHRLALRYGGPWPRRHDEGVLAHAPIAPADCGTVANGYRGRRDVYPALKKNCQLVN